MPYKSSKQRAYFYWAEAHGKMKRGTAARWQKETGKRKLPKRVKKRGSVNRKSSRSR